MTKLAVLGGAPMRDAKANPWPQWPVWDNKEEKALLENRPLENKEVAFKGFAERRSK